MTDFKALELIYRNSETREEMEIALEMHGISMEQLVDTAMERGWESSPIAIKNIASDLSDENITTASAADSDFIENANKASVRRLQRIFEHTVTKFQIEMVNMSTIAVIESLETLVKTREKLTKVEFPMYGLSTVEPPAPVNPIMVVLQNGDSA